jgi:hypothetical protein
MSGHSQNLQTANFFCGLTTKFSNMHLLCDEILIATNRELQEASHAGQMREPHLLDSVDLFAGR